jgi:hypothetical protein
VNLEAYRHDPYEDAMRVADLYFWMQRYKKKLRLQFLEDIARMKTEGADTEELMSRLIRHERARKVMRDAFDEVADNPRSRLNPSYNTLVELCDEYGLLSSRNYYCTFDQRQSEVGHERWRDRSLFSRRS